MDRVFVAISAVAVVLFVVLFTGRTALSQVTTPDDPNRVLIVYDAAQPDGDGDGVGDSQQIAIEYARGRGVPAGNLLAVSPTVTSYAYSGAAAWTRFWDEVVLPVQTKLTALGRTDIDTILLCFGLPYRINVPNVSARAARAIDSLLATPFNLGTRAAYTPPSYWYANPYLETSPTVGTDRGRFDHATYSFSGQPMYLVCRLDGPDVHAARELIEGARYGERYFSPAPGYYKGFGYIDTRYGQYTPATLNGYPFGYGSYQSADKCMAFGHRFVTAAGLPLKWEPTAKEIGETGAVYTDSTSALTAPQALFYGGWYNYRAYHDVWDWLPGSVACDVNSSSIQGLHTTTTVAFLTQSFQRGLTAGAGVIAEPYLSGHHKPEVLLHYLFSGFTFAEAAAVSNPSLQWVGVQMGDPLYTPFRAGRTPIKDQIPPPYPTLSVDVSTPGDAVVTAALDTTNGEPEQATAEVRYGPTRALGQSVPHDAVYRLRKSVTLTSLTADTLYHYAVELRDPAGLTRTTIPHVFFTKAPNPVLAHVAPATVTVPRGQSFDLTFVFSATPDLTAAQVLKIELVDETNNVTYDATFLAFAYSGGILVGPSLETAALETRFPAVLPVGKYTFRATIAIGASSRVATASVGIQ